jgi:uncharacterized delta-60 repeat protein
MARAGTEAQDLSFGVNGVALAAIASGNEVWNDVRIQADGRIVVAGARGVGTTASVFRIARYLPTGVLDTTFGGTGIVQIQLSNSNARSVAIQADGKILIAGDAAGSAGVNAPKDVAIARLNANGALDATFGTGGVVVSDLSGGQTDTAARVFVVPGGKIWAIGSASSPTNPAVTVWSIIAYNGNGTIDPSFGSGGRLLIDLGENVNFASALDAIVQNGKVVVVGTSGAKFIAARLDPVTGALDPTFGTGGIGGASFAGATLSARATSVIAQADGKLVLVGDGTFFDSDPGEVSPTLSYATRLTASGQIDPTFSAFQNGGIFSPNPTVRISGGRLIVKVGGAQLIRLNDNGSRDVTFGSGGIFTPPAIGSGIFSSLAVQADGNLVTAGQIFSNLQSDAAIIRVNISAAPPQPCTGDADGDRVVAFSDITSVLANFGASGQAFGPGDSDGSATVNFADVTTTLANFGVPCP